MAKVNIFVKVCIISWFCFSTTNAMAQKSFDKDDDLRTFFGGLLLGGNASQISGDGIEGFHKFGLNAGVMTYFKLSENIAGSLELLYNEKGSKYIKGIDPALANVGGKIYNKYGITLPYAEIPVVINYFDKRQSNAGMGLSYGQLFNEKEMLDSANLAPIYPFRKFDLSLILNGNLMFDKHWGLNIRYSYSMLNIRKTYNLDLLQRPQQYSRMWTLRAFYMF